MDRVEQLFDRVARDKPNEIAVTSPSQAFPDGISITFGCLRDSALQVAEVLKATPASHHPRTVCLLLDRGIEAFIGCVGVMYAQCVYAVLDPNDPTPWLRNQLQRINPTALLTSPVWLERAQSLARECFQRGDNAPDNRNSSSSTEVQLAVVQLEYLAASNQMDIWIHGAGGCDRFHDRAGGNVDEKAGGCEGRCKKRLRSSASGSNTPPGPSDQQQNTVGVGNLCHRNSMYIMATSGSSGRPKLVIGTHSSTINRIQWMWRTWPFDADGRELCGQRAPLTFVDSVWEMYGGLCRGVRTLIVPDLHQIGSMTDQGTHFERLLSVCRYHKLTRLTVVPSLVRQLQGAGCCDSIRVVISSGEPLTLRTCHHLRQAFPNAQILNLYGSTETAGDCSWSDVSRAGDGQLNQTAAGSAVGHGQVMSVGIALPSAKVAIATKEGVWASLQPYESRQSPEGVIVVGGECVSGGYLGEEPCCVSSLKEAVACESNIERFVVLRDTRTNYERWFITGDLGYIRDGQLNVTGRTTTTFKVHGKRLSCQLLESVIMNLIKKHELVTGSSSQRRSIVNKVVVVRAEDSVTVATLLVSAPFDSKASCSRRLSNIVPHISEPLESLLPRWMVPDYFVALDAASTDYTKPNGKTDRLAVLNAVQRHITQFVREEMADELPARAVNRQSVLEWVQRLVKADVGTGVEVTSDDTLAALGVDSLLSVKLAFELSSLVGRTVEFQTFLSSTIEDVVDHVTAILLLGESDAYPSAALKDLNEEPGNGKVRVGVAVDASNPSTSCNAKCLVVATASKGRSSTTAYESDVSRLVQSNKDDESVNISVKWEAKFDKCVDASPLIVSVQLPPEEGGNISRFAFIGSHDHTFAAIDMSTGGFVWRTTLGDRIEGSANCSPDNNVVIVGCYDGVIYALSLLTGEIQWTFTTGDQIKCGVAVDPLTGDVWCGSHDQVIYSINSTTGEGLWSLQCGSAVFATPVVDHSKRNLFVLTTKGVLRCIALSMKEEWEPPQLMWRYNAKSPAFSTPAVLPSGAIVFGCISGQVHCVSETGSKMWTFSAGEMVFSSPCFLSNRVLFGSHDHHLYCVAGESGKLEWKRDCGDLVASSPSVYLPNSRQIICCSKSGNVVIVDADNGAITSSISIAGPVFSSPVSMNGDVVIGSRSNSIFCISLSSNEDAREQDGLE